jgi:hypothetical protein
MGTKQFHLRIENHTCPDQMSCSSSSTSLFLSTCEAVGPWLEQLLHQPVDSVSTLDFSALHTLSLSHCTLLTDTVLRDLLAPRCVQIVELLLPHNP